MQTLATPSDLLQILKTRRSSAIALCQVEPDANDAIEQVLACSFSACWRLADGRYAGLYVSDDARVKAETLRRELEEQGLATLSIGLSLPRSDLGPSDLLLRAEQALETARKAGGNRVELAPRHDTSKTERQRLGRQRPQ